MIFFYAFVCIHYESHKCPTKEVGKEMNESWHEQCAEGRSGVVGKEQGGGAEIDSHCFLHLSMCIVHA